MNELKNAIGDSNSKIMALQQQVSGLRDQVATFLNNQTSNDCTQPNNNSATGIVHRNVCTTSAFASLVHPHKDINLGVSLVGKLACDFYRETMANGGSLPPLKSKQLVARANICMKWFNAMATKEERTLLLPPQSCQFPADNGERRRVVANLNRLIVAKLVQLYVSAGCALPRDLTKKEFVFHVSTLESRIVELKKKNFIICTDSFAAWRQERETNTSNDNCVHKKLRLEQ